MPNPTTNLGLTKATVGGSTDSWGGTDNTNFDLIDARLPKISFSALAASNQSITSNVFTKVTLGTEVFDIGGYFASSRFTPLVAGYYQINGMVRASDGTAITVFAVSLYKNGSEYRRGYSSGAVNSAAAMAASVSDLIFLNGSTDYVELFGLITGASPAFDAPSAAVASSMSGAFVTT